MNDNNKLIKVNNQVLRRTDRIIAITNKVIEQSDIEWWDGLEKTWKIYFSAIVKYYKEFDYEEFVRVNKERCEAANIKIPSKIQRVSRDVNTSDQARKILKTQNIIEPTKTDFEIIKQLEFLEFNNGYNLIYNTSKDFLNLKKLRLLHLLPHTNELLFLKNLKNLEYLSFKFKKQPTNIEALKHITKLRSLIFFEGENLTKNNLIDIAPLENLQKLETLKFYCFNTIKNANTINKLLSLKTLSLSAETFSKLKTLDALTCLECLKIYGCRKKTVSSILLDLSKLNKNTKLKSLEISRQNFKNIKWDFNFSKLEYLRLEYITSLENVVFIADYEKLKSLTLIGCNIKDISAIENLKHLNTLKLWSNKITEISHLKKIKNLKSLFLDDNPIKPSEIEGLKRHLPDCRITHD